MDSPIAEESQEERGGYTQWAQLVSSKKMREKSTNTTRLRIRALSHAPTKGLYPDTKNLPFRPVTISPTLLQPRDLKYSLKPYQIHAQKKALTKFGYSARPTASGWVEPWDDVILDHTILPKIQDKRLELSKSYDSSKKSKDQVSSTKSPKQSGTRLHPQYPVVSMPVKDWETKPLTYNDVKTMRKHLNKGFMKVNNTNKNDLYYIRTKKDFYSMELDNLKDVLPPIRSHMKSTYSAYLTITQGSRKAVKECLKETLSKQKHSHHEPQESSEENFNLQKQDHESELQVQSIQQSPPQSHQQFPPQSHQQVPPQLHQQFPPQSHQHWPQQSLNLEEHSRLLGQNLFSTSNHNLEEDRHNSQANNEDMESHKNDSQSHQELDLKPDGQDSQLQNQESNDSYTHTGV